MPLNLPGSCFVDAVELALGCDSRVIQAYVNHHFPDADCDNRGYHPSLLNIAMLEIYKIGLTKVDAMPLDFGSVDDEGGPLPRLPKGEVMDVISGWFLRPGFRCVIQGPSENGAGEHANAWNGSCWVDPIKPDEGMEQPNVSCRSVWLTTIPGTKVVTHGEPKVPETDTDEAE